jgi:hypothetical protein
MATTTKGERARARRAAAARRDARRKGLLAGLAALGLLLAGLLWWLATGDSDSDVAATDSSVEQFMHVHGLAVPSWADGDVFLSTHQGLIRISGEDDERWQFVSEEPHDFMGFAAHPHQEGTLYSSGHPAPGSGVGNPIGLMVSQDGGVTWEQRSLQGEVDFHTMAVSPADGDVLYGWFREEFFVSRDAGHSWERTSAEALVRTGGVVSLAGHPDDPDEVWAGTPAGLLRSPDAGRTWEPVAGGQTTAVGLDPSDGDRVLAYAAEGLKESRDSGQSWTALDLTLEDDAVGYIAVHPEDPEVIYVGTYGQGLLRSNDGGATWTELAVDGVPRG